jgi:iron complex outermembrane receptor protein
MTQPNKTEFVTKLRLAAALPLAILLPAAVMAQTPPPPPPTANVTTLQDVVITARHRAERAQTVPISMTVVDKQQIKNLGSNNLLKIKQLVPSLTITLFNPRNTSIDIRGLGNAGFTLGDGLEGGVAVYVDGVLQGRPTSANFDLPDIADIEVLRGPQGTLFGKNAIAGAINIRTRLPSYTPEADYSASYGNYNYWNLQGYATSALGNSDKAAVSLAVHADQDRGFIKNVVTGQNYQNTDDKGIQAQVLLQPNSQLTIRIIGGYDTQDSNCCYTQPFQLVTNYANGAPVSVNILNRYANPGVNYKLPPLTPFPTTTDIDSWTHYAMETGNLALLADYNLDGFTLSSITAGSYFNWYPHIDPDGVGIPILTEGNDTTTQRQFTQELRLTSPTGGRVDYTTGLFFFYQQLNDQAVNTYGSDMAAFSLPGGTTNPAYGTYQAAVNGLSSASTDIPETYSGAAYAQATWHITPQWDLTGGARFTYEDKTGVFYSTQEGGATLAPGSAAQAIRNAYAAILSYHLQHSDMLPGGLVTLSYKPQPNILTYATYSHGERSAGLNMIASLSTPKVVAPEKIDNYEIGAKTTLLGGRLLLNGDGFWDEDTDYQSTVIASINGNVLSYLASVPKVRSRGIEIDSRAQVTDGLSLFASAVFDDAINQSNPSGACPYEDSNVAKSCDLTGRPLATISKWSGAFGGEYDQPLPPINGRNILVYFAGNFALRSGFYSTVDDSKYSYVPGYGIGNLSFGIRQQNGAWDLSGWIHNFTNTRYYIFREVSGGTPTYNLVAGEIGDPLMFGITLRGKFN